MLRRSARLDARRAVSTSWKPGRSSLGIEFFDQIDNEPGYIIPFFADLDPQDAVGKFEADLRVPAEIIRERRLAVASCSS